MMRLRDLTIRAKLYGLILFSGIGLSAVLGLSLWVLYEYRVNGPVYNRLSRRAGALAEVEPATFYAGHPYLILQEMATTSDPAEVKRLNENLSDMERQVRAREAYWMENLYEGPLKTALTAEVIPSINEFYVAARQEFLPLINTGDHERAGQVLTKSLRPRLLAQREVIARAVKASRETSQHEEAAAREATRFWLTTMIVMSIGSVVVIFSCGWLVAREILRPTGALIRRVDEMATGASDLTARIAVESQDELGRLANGINSLIAKIQLVVQRVRQASVQVLSTASEMAATAKQQETTMHGLGSSTTEIAAAVREISATGKQLAGTMAEVSERASQAAQLATGGRSDLAKMEDRMKQLLEATDSIASKLAIIREKAENINVVVTTITKVADQTNLLSINAAIEAEKAGEYGRGFLVVAREIRRLADQTAVATLDIENIVRHMQDAVSAGVMQMDKFSGEMRGGVQRVGEINGQTGQIIQEVQTLSERFDLVNEGMHNQSLGAEQINEAMVQLTDGARQTQIALEEFHKAAAHLRESVELLNADIAQFTI
jgi:methyl-accepting chemotaxis protein WspA